MDCPTCGKTLATAQGARQHHTRVHGDPLPNRTCERCGSEFAHYPSNKEGVYCPDCVRDADEFRGDHFAEVDDIERVERACVYRGSQFSVLPCVLRQDRGRFCSHDCLCDWLSDERGDGSAVYNGDWLSVKRETLKRDGPQCQYCGLHRTEMGREPDVHHIVPVREFDDPQDAHTLENLVSLCRSCHRYVEVGEIPESAIHPSTS